MSTVLPRIEAPTEVEVPTLQETVWSFQAAGQPAGETLTVEYYSYPDARGLLLPGIGEDLTVVKGVLQYLGERGIRMAGLVPPYLSWWSESLGDISNE